MIQAELRGKGMCQRVRCAQVFLKRNRPHGGCHLHISPCLDILAVARGPLEVTDYKFQPVDGDGVAQRMEYRTRQALQAVSEGVHAGRRREEWRQAYGQFRGEYGGLGDQPPAGDGSAAAGSGSRMARLGISHGLKMMIFRPSLCEVIPEDRPTSLPVPEVVGIAMMGSYGPFIRSVPPACHSSSVSAPSCRAMTTTALETSIALPPPSPMAPSQPAER